MQKTTLFNITDMTCASCVLHIEKDVKALKGVASIAVNFAASKGEVTYDCHKITPEEIVAAIKKTGYTATVADSEKNKMDHGSHSEHNSHSDQGPHHDHAAMESKKEINSKLYKFIFGAVASVIIIILGFLVEIPSEGMVMLILTLLTLIYTGQEFYLRGIPSLFKIRPNMDTLVALGVSAAFLLSSYNVLFAGVSEEYFMDATIIATFIMFGRYLEAKAKGSANEAIKKLLQLSAKMAHKIVGNNQTIDIPVEQVKKGDLLLVKPGEKIPVDGVITKGEAIIDESMVTGESIPVDKSIRSNVIGATINSNTVFTMRAENVGAKTMLAQMIKLVEQAQMQKAPIQKLVDLVSNYFVWGVLMIAIITFTSWYYIVGVPLSQSLIYTVAVLIIACPCALGLATPISIVVGSGRGASKGILIKKAESLEKMHKITTICFDKTGTITKGRPEVQEFKDLKDSNETLIIATSLEANSEHPLARSILDFAAKKQIKALEVKGFTAVTGKGVTAEIKNKQYFLGSTSYIKSQIKISTEIINKLNELQSKGYTLLLVSDSKELLGYFAVQDGIKETSKEAIRLLHERNIKTVMMTGDNEQVAQKIAKEVGIDQVFAGVTPSKKNDLIKEFQKKGEYVTMVGDGINDAPALATADVGIAMGTGTDIAMEAGDIVLVKGDLLKAVEAIELSRATFRNIKQNLFWAFIYNSVGIPFAALGFLNPIVSSLAMAFSSISVVLNALRLKRF